MTDDIYSVSLDDMMPLICERLAAGQSVKFSPHGVSMLPLLRQGRDSVVLSPVTGKLKKYDLPLYMRDNGEYVLHRIVEVGQSYVCIGDNQFVAEKGVRQDQLIGVVTAFHRGGREHRVNEFGYRIYCRLWHHSRAFRHLWRRGIRWIKRHIK